MKWSDFGPYVLPHALGCPDPTMEQHVRLAATAFEQYGRGRHPAKLNYGDCFAYALAKQRREPLLFRGDDFSLTDLVPAL